MAKQTALYDASVLYAAPLRDLLMHLALTDLFRAKWTATIHDEWTRNVLHNRPDLDPQRIHRARQLMDEHVRDCLVTGYEDLIPTLHLPDPDDRHVLAAAIRGRADVIVTLNLKHFPAKPLAPFAIEALHPDEFVMRLLNLSEAAVLQAVREQRENLRRPPVTADQLLATFKNQGLIQTAAALQGFSDVI